MSPSGQMLRQVIERITEEIRKEEAKLAMKKAYLEGLKQGYDSAPEKPSPNGGPVK